MLHPDFAFFCSRRMPEPDMQDLHFLMYATWCFAQPDFGAVSKKSCLSAEQALFTLQTRLLLMVNKASFLPEDKLLVISLLQQS